MMAILFAFGTTGVFAEDHESGEHADTASSSDTLSMALAAQDDDAKARYQYRHPEQTLTFFGIKPGMKVGEALPGGGWYTKILLPFLGESGHLVGIDYAYDMWPNFGGFANEEFLEKRKTWAASWVENAQPWRGESGASVSATSFGAFPADIAGTLDAILFFRALHNLARFEDKGDFFSKALTESYKALKPGGVVGIVQHHAREDRPDSWADGSNGYLKKSRVIEAMQAAGFLYEAESDINANDRDQAGEGDVVWRLPPTLGNSKDDPELKAKMLEIGESNRMTLRFRKPS
ncbi:MAG: class I SAM-dependent methyltransferase [Gammaproteobacteria bacterium]|nr:class I SAM-dependent methyltransferase [Gammaproteobacteria bacterium]